MSRSSLAAGWLRADVLLDDLFSRHLAVGSSNAAGWLRAGMGFFAVAPCSACGTFGDGGCERADTAGWAISGERLVRGLISSWLPAAVLPEAGVEAPLRLEAGWLSAALRNAFLTDFDWWGA